MFFHSLALEAFCHATEDPDRVKKAVLGLVPFKPGEGAFEERRYDGSFGNDIVVFSIEFTKQRDIRAITDSVRGRLPGGELSGFDVAAHVNEDNVFWMRFDKQKAYGGVVSLGGGDTVELRGRIAAFPARRERALEMMEELWG